MPPEKQNNNILTSWKQIAGFLGVSERTAQHWEGEKGLPVKRLAGTKGRVSADVADLERWIKDNLKATPWYASLRFLRYYSAIASGLLLLAVGILVGIRMANRLGPPEDCRLDYRTLIVTDLGGREVWRYSFPDPFLIGAYDQGSGNSLKKAWFVKLNPEDREVSTIFPYYPVTVDETGGGLFCFSPKGKEKWRFDTTTEVSDHEQTYPPTYVIADYCVSPIEEGGPNRIFVTSHNTYGDPNRFTILDGDGVPIGDYWHSGHLSLLAVEDLDGDGVKEILLAGVNNGHGRAVMHVLDPRNVKGAFSQPAGDKKQLMGFDPGTQIATVLFPRTCINRKFQYNELTRLSVLKDSIKVDVMEVGGDHQAIVIYRFGKDLIPKRPIISDHLINLHATMRSKGELDHDYSESEVDDLAKSLLIRKNCK